MWLPTKNFVLVTILAIGNCPLPVLNEFDVFGLLESTYSAVLGTPNCLPLFRGARSRVPRLLMLFHSIGSVLILLHAFPPFALISKCLEKIRRERANLVLICPVWASQPWFPVALEMLCDVPRLLRRSPKLLTSPLGEPHPLLSSNSLQLAAWRLSGDPSLSKAFRSEWSTFCWPVIDLQQSLLTIPAGGIGVIGVCKGVKIPCRLL